MAKTAAMKPSRPLGAAPAADGTEVLSPSDSSCSRRISRFWRSGDPADLGPQGARDWHLAAIDAPFQANRGPSAPR